MADTGVVRERSLAFLGRLDGGVDAVAQILAWLESHGIAGLDLDRFTGLRVLAGTRTAMTFFEGAETDQGHGVLVQGTRDAVENRVQNLIGLFLTVR